MTQTCLRKYSPLLNRGPSMEVGAFCHDWTGLRSDRQPLDKVQQQTNKAECRLFVPRDLQEGNK